MAQPKPKRGVLNVPNVLTLARLLCCAAFFAILVFCADRVRLPVDGEGELSWKTFRGKERVVHSPPPDPSQYSLLFDVALGIFLLAAATDIADGQIARRYDLVTDLGRIADPFVDKIMILGTFTLFLPLTVYVRGWMLVLLLARELLVSGIRGFAESRGIAFPATFWGKTKMVSQTATAAFGILYLGHHEAIAAWGRYTFIVLLWWTLAATVLSGGVYVRRAMVLLAAKAPPSSGEGSEGGKGRVLQKVTAP